MYISFSQDVIHLLICQNQHRKHCTGLVRNYMGNWIDMLAVSVQRYNFGFETAFKLSSQKHSKITLIVKNNSECQNTDFQTGKQNTSHVKLSCVQAQDWLKNIYSKVTNNKKHWYSCFETLCSSLQPMTESKTQFIDVWRCPDSLTSFIT